MSIQQQATCMVVGGTGNVGRHVVQALLATDAAVVVPSRDQRRLDDLAHFLPLRPSGRFIPILGDMSDGEDAGRVLRETGPIDGAVASLGDLVQADSVLAAPQSQLDRALDGYLHAHRSVARTLVPHLQRRGGGYIMINGPLAFEPLFPGTGLVSIATAAQAMLARVLMKETAHTGIRINELVIRSRFGTGNDEGNEVTGADIGRYIAWLLSPDGAGIRERTIHLSPEVIDGVPVMLDGPRIRA